jgi:hypothetical protein
MKFKNHTVRDKRAEIRKLEKRADALYQIRCRELKPLSIISGEPTEVIHHFVPKSQSNNLRYDISNGIPLTNREHCRHHLSGDPSIVAKIVIEYGTDWYNILQQKRHQIQKHTKEYLEGVIDRLSTPTPF